MEGWERVEQENIRLQGRVNLQPLRDDQVPSQCQNDTETTQIRSKSGAIQHCIASIKTLESLITQGTVCFITITIAITINY